MLAASHRSVLVAALAALVVTLGARALGGCADPAPPPPPHATLAAPPSPPAGPDDLEVARVDGRPVWGSCVAAQVARGAPTRAAALDECIAFELLAQAAERRGLAAAPEVAEATRAAMVDRLVAREFEDRHRTPADLGATLDAVLAKNAGRMSRPDLRASTYVRANVPAGAAPEVEAAARAVIEEVARELADEAGLLPAHVRALAGPIGAARGVALEYADVRASVRESWDPPYGDALYAIPEVGRASGPVRTRWGWDVVVWTGGLPPRTYTREALAAEAFPEVRRQMFTSWVNQLVRASGARVTIDEGVLARLDGERP